MGYMGYMGYIWDIYGIYKGYSHSTIRKKNIRQLSRAVKCEPFNILSSSFWQWLLLGHDYQEIHNIYC